MTRVTPNQPKTPLRSFRVPDELWMPARDKAHREGITITDVLQRALREYLGADTQTPPGERGNPDNVSFGVSSAHPPWSERGAQGL